MKYTREEFSSVQGNEHSVMVKLNTCCCNSSHERKFYSYIIFMQALAYMKYIIFYFIMPRMFGKYNIW